jgi:hypothetical protein
LHGAVQISSCNVAALAAIVDRCLRAVKSVVVWLADQPGCTPRSALQTPIAATLAPTTPASPVEVTDLGATPPNSQKRFDPIGH